MTTHRDHTETVPVLNLLNAPGQREAWQRSWVIVVLWAACERLFVTNSWQISSKIRVAILRRFGAEIGDHVIFRPRTRVMFPWNLRVGDRSWIGEGVWIQNQAQVDIGSDVVLSQETFLSTGSHRHRVDMGLIMRPISIEDGAWVTSRCMILGGAKIGRSALIRPMSLIEGVEVESGAIWGGNPAIPVGWRWERSAE